MVACRAPATIRPMRLIPWEEERLQSSSPRPSSPAAAGPPACCSTIPRPSRSSATRCSRRLARARRTQQVEAAGRAAVDPDQVLDGVRELLDEVRLEVLLGDGSRVIALRDPLGRGRPPDPLGPGALVIGDRADIEVNEGRETIELAVTSTSRRRIRISSHYPFHRVNPRLELDREAAGASASTCRPAATWAGSRARRRRCGWSATRARAARTGRDGGGTMTRLSAEEYRLRYGATTGDRVRLGDTNLWVKVAEDRTARGDEPVWGYAKNLRLGHGPVGPGDRPVGARHRAHGRARRSTPSSASSRPTSASRTAASRASGGRAARRSATASTSSSAPTRSRTWPTG